MQIRILLFAALRERAGTGAIDVELDGGATLADAARALEHRHPGLLVNTRAATAVNGSYERNAARALADGDEVAFLPPVSGG